MISTIRKVRVIIIKSGIPTEEYIKKIYQESRSRTMCAGRPSQEGVD